MPPSCCSVSLPALCCVLQVLPLVLEKALNVVERMAAMAAANPGNAVFDVSDGVRIYIGSLMCSLTPGVD
jgi:hypothetical protein